MAATGSFYSARGIGSQASVGAAVDEERSAGKTLLINCFKIETVFCDLYLKRFNLTKGLLFDTFVITVWYKLCRCDHSVLKYKSFSPLTPIAGPIFGPLSTRLIEGFHFKECLISKFYFVPDLVGKYFPTEKIFRRRNI